MMLRAFILASASRIQSLYLLILLSFSSQLTGCHLSYHGCRACSCSSTSRPYQGDQLIELFLRHLDCHHPVCVVCPLRCLCSSLYRLNICVTTHCYRNDSALMSRLMTQCHSSTVPYRRQCLISLPPSLLTQVLCNVSNRKARPLSEISTLQYYNYQSLIYKFYFKYP